MKKAIALCLLVCCMSMSAVAETAIVNTKSSPLTMRATAGDSGKTLVKIPKGETVEVLEKGDWALVAYDGKQGYVNARYLEYIEETPASTPVPTPAPTKEVDFTNVPDDVRELYGKWINVKNGDVYCFDLDGVATHDETSATYQIEGDLVHIFVGVAALIPTTLTINRQAKYPRLVVEDMSSYYVPSTEYEAISAALRDETTQYLTSVEFWTAPASGVVNYVSFNKNGVVGSFSPETPIL